MFLEPGSDVECGIVLGAGKVRIADGTAPQNQVRLLRHHEAIPHILIAAMGDYLRLAHSLNPGMQLHKLDSAWDKNFRSVQVESDIRMP